MISWAAVITVLFDLQALSLDGNQLAFIYTKAFHGISGLLSLALQNNNINFLGNGTFSTLTQLTTLLLQNNQINQRIERGTFDALESLTYIDLSRNQLTSENLPPALLRRSTKLRHVYFDDNQLETVDSCMLAAQPHHGAARTLSLLGNPITCDCSLMWLLRLRYYGRRDEVK